jgi:putative ribosome biogenesis GTPase RsgA
VTPTTVAIDLIELGANALMNATPGMSRHEAVTMSAVVMAATFPELAALVAEQAHDRAVKHHYGGPVAAVAQFAAELRAQAQEASP